MRNRKTYVCEKCGKPFVKWSGGFMPDIDIGLTIHPICNKCKIKKLIKK